MRKYSNKKLYELSNEDCPMNHWGKYKSRLTNHFKKSGFDYDQLQEEDKLNYIVHQDMYFDAYKIINDLAGQLLKEREIRKKLTGDLINYLRHYITRVKSTEQEINEP